MLVDSNVLLDVLTEDARWFEWSSSQLAACADRGSLAINPLIYSEISVGFESLNALDAALPASTFRRLNLPWEAAFLAGQQFLLYRQRTGTRRSPLPDFYIGAHAEVSRLELLTRDTNRYSTYFPAVKLIAPDPAPKPD